MTWVLVDETGVIIQRQPEPEEGFVEAPDDVCCGMVKQGDVFVSPVPQDPDASLVPIAVTPAQAMIALDAMGLLEDIENWVATQPRVTRIAWERVQEFRRDSPALLAGAAALGWADALLDEIFVAASNVVI